MAAQRASEDVLLRRRLRSAAGTSAVIVSALVVLALALRVVFVVRSPKLPLYWDELHYDAWAFAYRAAWHALWGGGPALERFRSAFLSSLPKGEAYSAFVGLVYASAARRRHSDLCWQ